MGGGMPPTGGMAAWELDLRRTRVLDHLRREEEVVGVVGHGGPVVLLVGAPLEQEDEAVHRAASASRGTR